MIHNGSDDRRSCRKGGVILVLAGPSSEVYVLSDSERLFVRIIPYVLQHGM